VSIPLAEQSFVLKTQYPGLLLGLGYPHDDGSGAPELIKLGCSLDYVSGLPVIPGSTVKGVLRSLFKKGNAAKATIEALTKKSDLNLDQLVLELFDADSEDVYFDAYPITEGTLLAFESITPHASGLAESNPIKLLKVPPDVEFLFRFRLKDKGLLSAAEKRKLFRELLLLTGIGAKTNVGFGAMVKENDRLEYRMLVPAVGESMRPAAAPKAEGLCRECGKPTKRHNKTGKYHSLCFDCFQRMGRA